VKVDKLFIIVKGGRVEEVYSTKTLTELYTEILDFDSIDRTEAEEKALQFRYDAVRELMYRVV
jgi:hypothetical protein